MNLDGPENAENQQRKDRERACPVRAVDGEPFYGSGDAENAPLLMIRSKLKLNLFA